MENKTLKQAVTIALNEKCDASSSHWSQAAVAKRARVNPAYVSAIKSNKDTHNGTPIPFKYYESIANVLGIDTSDVPLHWETQNFRRIQKMCKYAQGGSKFVLLDGTSQIGKTYSLEHFAKVNEKVVYVKATSSMSQIIILKRILLNWYIDRDIPYQYNKMIDLFKDKIQEKGWLIIIDELEDLQSEKRGYRAVTELCKFCEGGQAGVVICGAGLITKLQKKAAKMQAPYLQMYNRFSAVKVELPKVDMTEIKAILKEQNLNESSAIAWFDKQQPNMKALKEYIKDLKRLETKKGVSLAEVTASILKKMFEFTV